MQLLPLAAVFVLGVILRKYRVVEERHSSLLLRLVFYVGLPIVIFLSVMRIELDKTLVYLAIFPPIVMFMTITVAMVLRHTILGRVRTKTFAAMLAGAAIMNQSFLIPFIAGTYGADGLARIVIIESFNAIMIFSLLYITLAALGNKRPQIAPIVRQVLLAPTLWALVLGIAFKLSDGHLSSGIMALFVPFAWLVSLALLLALGIKFRARLKSPHLFIIALCLRFGLGGIIGLGFIKLLGLHGLDAEIILIASLAPFGLNTITLAEIEKLDLDYAVSAVSGGLVIGLVAVPFIIHFVHAMSW